MKVNELIQELQKCPQDLEVFTKKTEIMGTIGETFHVYEDTAFSDLFYHVSLFRILMRGNEHG